jgi:HD-GYP domain-containing protein (c-di-GMP phosphodiesterase class II)
VKLTHLTMRFFGALSPAAPRPSDVDWAATILTPANYAQWKLQPRHDQRHTVRVARTVQARLAGTPDEGDSRWLAAALLHDIGKLDVSRDLLYKAARLTKEEYEQMQQHVAKGVAMLEPVGGSLRRVIPIVLAHHDKFDGSGYHPSRGQEIPLEARIISVADVYDSLTSDRPYRKAMSPFEAKEIIVKGSGTEFDPKVVDAFLNAFRLGELEVPTVVV